MPLLWILVYLALTVAASPPTTDSRTGYGKNILMRIGNGVESKPKTRTYMAVIGTGDEDNKQWVCGGSVIAPTFILSAAHCSSKFGPATWVRVGDLDLKSLTDDAEPQDRKIVEVISHPLHQPPEFYNDIALFRLDRSLIYNSYVQPLCLYRPNSTPGGKGVVSGWGRTGWAMLRSSKLLEATLDFYNDSECALLHEEYTKHTPRGIDTATMFCAGKEDGSRDECEGDSGGPIVLELAEDGDSEEWWSGEEECRFAQVGVISYGDYCMVPDSPGVYTRVSAYLDWVEYKLSQYASPIFLIYNPGQT